MAGERLREETINAFFEMRAGFRCLENYDYYDYAMAFDGVLIFCLSYWEWGLFSVSTDKAGKDSSCRRIWA